MNVNKVFLGHSGLAKTTKENEQTDTTKECKTEYKLKLTT